MWDNDHAHGVHRARERDHGENEDETEVEDHVFDDHLLEDHEEHVQLLGDAAEQDEVGHPAEEEHHRRRLEVRLTAACARMTVVPVERSSK